MLPMACNHRAVFIASIRAVTIQQYRSSCLGTEPYQRPAFNTRNTRRCTYQSVPPNAALFVPKRSTNMLC